MESPKHYKNFDTLDYVRVLNLPFTLANAVKYCVRAGLKEGEPMSKDLDKAISYLEYEIELLSGSKYPEIYQLSITSFQTMVGTFNGIRHGKTYSILKDSLSSRSALAYEITQSIENSLSDTETLSSYYTYPIVTYRLMLTNLLTIIKGYNHATTN